MPRLSFAFTGRHSGETFDYAKNLLPGVDVRQVWDRFNDAALLGEAGAGPEVVEAFYRRRIDGYPAVPAYDAEALGDEDVFIVSLYSREGLDEMRTALHERLVSLCGQPVGSDDSTFSYFPDLCLVLRTICHEVGMDADYRRAYEALLRTTAWSKREARWPGTLPAPIEPDPTKADPEAAFASPPPAAPRPGSRRFSVTVDLPPPAKRVDAVIAALGDLVAMGEPRRVAPDEIIGAVFNVISGLWYPQILEVLVAADLAPDDAGCCLVTPELVERLRAHPPVVADAENGARDR